MDDYPNLDVTSEMKQFCTSSIPRLNIRRESVDIGETVLASEVQGCTLDFTNFGTAREENVNNMFMGNASDRVGCEQLIKLDDHLNSLDAYDDHMMSIDCNIDIKEEANNSEFRKAAIKIDCNPVENGEESEQGDDVPKQIVQRAFKCPICEYSSSYKYNVKKHFTLKHDAEAELLLCPYCDYATKLRPLLIAHFRSKHDEMVEQFNCQSCDYKTKDKKCLKRHFAIKHDEKATWYHCPDCEFTTKLVGTLKKHVTIIHNKEAKWYNCEICDFKTHYKTYLTRHFTAKHDEEAKWYECQNCVFRTRDKYHIKRHFERKHRKEAKLY